MRPSLILIGGGGHCKSCIDVIEQEGRFEVAGIVDLPENLNRRVLGYRIIGTDEDLPELISIHGHVLVTLGQIGSGARRNQLFTLAEELGARFPVICSPLAYVSRHARVGDGTIVMHQAVINAAASVGKNCIINTKALVEHDALIQDHCHIATGAIVNGGATVGSHTFWGSGAVSKQEVCIPAGSFLKANSLIKDPP